MSKVSGINLGNPNEPFQVYGSQLGGRDSAIVVQRQRANVNRENVVAYVKQVGAAMKEISSLIERLEVMEEMMVIDEDTDAVLLDKNFIDEYSKNIEALKVKFEEIVKAANK